ncbi:WAP four-disulfide core domain protein 12-like [Mauremys mutica]|uniref:WAP four-disulfide core domain protein 12-like n=1 Tax=Mauremys mutica TaxID=74926 RepID=UPI001D162D32|nr:WAP four-disulfide core domain protein 12-like [Mauremys mutica]
MKSVGVLLLLVGLLTFWTELPAATVLKQVKAGTCPPDYTKCYRGQTDECATDYDCKEQKKCCDCHFAMRCVEAAEA